MRPDSDPVYEKNAIFWTSRENRPGQSVLMSGAFTANRKTVRLAALTSAPAGLANPAAYQAGGYIKKLPDDPWGNAYLYASPGKHGAFDVWTNGADGKEGGEGINADIGSWQ
jgi:type II secretion system protein G